MAAEDCQTPNGRLHLDRKDIELVDTFRRQKDTSVLTIMFTDIKGFTRLTEEKGEKWATDLRRKHDEILHTVIEEASGGKVVKHIGDSVMAVFSEPSTAVARALAIQRNIREFNRTNPDGENLEVRIGLHMGQVTTENQVDMDVFGRHVNRASRVEGLADGGQVYLTYPVFDSARGWLSTTDIPGLDWTLHGRYFVKGIDQAIEIYEVVDTRISAPHAPSGARRKRPVPTLAISALLVMAGMIATLVFLQIKKTSVSFINLPNAPLILDHSSKVIIDGEPTQRMRSAISRIPAGRHVLHWEYSYLVRYYADIMVKRGENHIEPKFSYNCLPSLARHTSYSEEGENEETASRSYTYVSYDPDNTRQENTADLQLSITIEKDASEEKKLVFTYSWVIVVNGKEIHRSTMTRENVIDNDETLREETVVYQDDFLQFSVKYYIIRFSTELTVEGNFNKLSLED